MAAQTCKWSHIFDDQSRANLEEGFLITGALSALLGCWLNLALSLTNLRSDLSYRNLAFFTVIACVRRTVSFLSHLSFLHYAQSSNYKVENSSCDFYGFWETFLSVLEVECLTHVCIERYVVAKYITKGWSIQYNHYILYPCLCVLFALLYSTPPLFGLGRFGFDFSCQSCVLDMVLTVDWHRYVVVTIFLLRSVKSTGFILTMLIWARNLEAKYDNSAKLVKEMRFTEVCSSLCKEIYETITKECSSSDVVTESHWKRLNRENIKSMHKKFLAGTVIIIAAVNLICWTPIALIRGWVVFSYLLSYDLQVSPSASAIQWAIWIHWVSPAITAIAMFIVDDEAHKKMLSVCKSKKGVEEATKTK